MGEESSAFNTDQIKSLLIQQGPQGKDGPLEVLLSMLYRPDQSLQPWLAQSQAGAALDYEAEGNLMEFTPEACELMVSLAAGW